MKGDLMKKYFSNLINWILFIVVACLGTVVGNHDLNELPSLFVTFIFIPTIAFLINNWVNYKLNKEDYLEKRIKQNDLFLEKKMITLEQHQKEWKNITNIVQNLPQYKEKKLF